MSMIEDALLQISKNLKGILEVQKERLEIEKRAEIDNKKGMEKAMKLSDIMLGKGEKFQKDLLEILGIPEKIDIDGIEGVDINK